MAKFVCGSGFVFVQSRAGPPKGWSFILVSRRSTAQVFDLSDLSMLDPILILPPRSATLFGYCTLLLAFIIGKALGDNHVAIHFSGATHTHTLGV